MRPYHVYAVMNGHWQVDNTYQIRPTRNSAGMTYTFERHPHNPFRPLKPPFIERVDVVKLVTRGTCDPLAIFSTICISRAPCPCCGSRNAGKRVLSESGRRRLRRLQRQRRDRLA